VSSVAQQIKSKASIVQVWSALGGGKLRLNRGVCFWRKGADGFNVSLDARQNVWFDHVAGQGGDTIALVEQARGCGFKAAVVWLADFLGVNVSSKPAHRDRIDTSWPSDLKWATYWRISVEALTELTLETLSDAHPERFELTVLLRVIRHSDSGLVGEYRRWKAYYPQLTHALARAGRSADARLQRRLALWITERDRG
jgi:hypothetical protein